MKCDVKESNLSQFYGKIIGGGGLPYLTYISLSYPILDKSIQGVGAFTFVLKFNWIFLIF